MHTTQTLREIADRVASALRYMDNIDHFERARQSKHYTAEGVAATDKLIAQYRPALEKELAAISDLVSSLTPPAEPTDAVMRALRSSVSDTPAARHAVSAAVTEILNVHGTRGERILTDEERNLFHSMALDLDQTNERGRWRTSSDQDLIQFTIGDTCGLVYLQAHDKVTVARALARDSVLPILIEHCTDDAVLELEEALEDLSKQAPDQAERIEVLQLGIKIAEALAQPAEEPAPR